MGSDSVVMVSCPCCGSKDIAVVRNWGERNEVFVACNECLASTKNFQPQKGAAQAARDAWNRGEIK